MLIYLFIEGVCCLKQSQYKQTKNIIEPANLVIREHNPQNIQNTEYTYSGHTTI